MTEQPFFSEGFQPRQRKERRRVAAHDAFSTPEIALHLQ